MFKFHTYVRWGVLTLLLALIGGPTTLLAQERVHSAPTWWFGLAGAADFNYHRGTTQVLNASVKTPAPFHRGYGVGYYAGILAEYRPGPVWGAMLNVGYDDREGIYDTVTDACGCAGNLKTSLTYITIAPSLRVAPFSSGFHLFAGPRLGFNLSDDFRFKRDGKPGIKVEGEYSDIRSTIISGEVGAGYDINLSSATSSTKVSFSPFVSFHPYFGQDPRSIETWNITTLRVGAAIKFGRGKVVPVAEVLAVLPPLVLPDVVFTVRAPLSVPVTKRVRETFPLGNYVFFDAGSQRIPDRYVRLSVAQATDFRESQLQDVTPENLDGRSARQMAVYSNVLNILGDRMRSNPGASVTLVGASGRGATDGTALAESAKQYLVDVFGVDAGSIATTGRVQPVVSSDQPGSTSDQAMRRAENRRVDIESTSPALLSQVGGPPNMLRPVLIISEQQDPLDSHAIFTVNGADELLASWTLELTDPQLRVQTFGPFTQDVEAIPAATILDNNTQGSFDVVMLGTTNNGATTRKVGTLQLVVPAAAEPEVLRFSVLFAFDSSTSVEKYNTFLTDVVAPLVPAGSNVIIRGHTDSVGDAAYNHTLAYERALHAERILKAALASAGTRRVTFETFGFGEDPVLAPFENTRPEQRFYNRTVIIDVVQQR